MTKNELKIRSISVQMPIFPEHIRSLLCELRIYILFPEHVRSLCVFKYLGFNIFRSMSTHFSVLSVFLCIRNITKCKDMAGIIIEMSKIKRKHPVNRV